MTDVKSTPTRRTLLKGAAWSVPAITVAVTAPSAAASESSVPVIGDFWESSMQIGKTKVGMSALFVDCVDARNDAPWRGKVFLATIVIEYLGANDAFSFADAQENTHWVPVKVEKHRIELTSTMTVNGCGTGSLQFYPLDITFNGHHENAPLEEPGADSIRVSASAIAQDGSFAVGKLFDATPCSPTKNTVPVGPREVPGTC